jgi:diguanylate cyclase (GGDEF)-like protein/PAS domain S-box-containing protein
MSTDLTRAPSLPKAFIACVLAFVLAVGNVLAETGQEVRIGVLHHRGKAVAERSWGPLVAYLNERIPEYRFRIVPLDYAELHSAVAEQRVDLTFTAAGQYVELELRHGATRIATVETTGPRGRFAEYGGVFVVRASDTALRSLEDLRGKTFLIPSESSFGGWQMQLREMRQAGLSQAGRDFRIVVSGDNEKVFLDLLAGKGDVATARSDVLERMAGAGKVRMDDFRLIRSPAAPKDYAYWVSTRLYPDWPLATMRHASPDVAERLLVALFSLSPDHPAAKAAEIAGWTVPRDYQPVHELFRELAIGPYANGHFDWNEFLRRYVAWIAGTMLALAVVFGILLLRVMRANRRLADENRQRREAEAALRAERDRSATYLDLMGNMFVVLDREGRVELANRRAHEVLGYSSGELVGRDWIEVIVPEAQRADVRATLDRLLEGRLEGVSVYENEVVTRDGKLRQIHWNNRFLRNDDGYPVATISAGEDITEQRVSEAQIRLFAKVVESTSQGIMISDADNCIISVNPAFTHITGYHLDEVRGKNPRILSSGRQGVDFYREMWREINSSGRWEGELWNRDRSGEVYPEWLSVTALKNRAGIVTNYVGIFTDITRHKEDEAKIHFLAHFDPLTRLPNRTLLADRFRKASATAQRNDQKMAVLFIDLDRFKQINDSLGHLVGDKLLQGVAARFTSCIREADTLARLGGDEFILLLPDVEAPEDAAAVAQRCMESLRPAFTIDGHELQVTPSIGIAICPQDGESLDTLVKNADTAMYAAKDAGRDCWRFFTGDMNARIFARMLLENQLRRAIERQEFVLHYQPQLDILSGRVIGVEALVRWQHPEQGLVYPGDFITVAEESGLIAEIGSQVLREACRQLAAWHAAGLPKFTVAVNVSAPQFRTKEFYETVTTALGDAGLAAGYLELELTESILVHNVDTTLRLLQDFKRLGVMLSVDDFGTGYSSLSYLKRFPVDRLKVDQSFVRGLTHDMDDRAIVASVIAMGKHLRLRVLAEGVETADHLEILRKEGCDEYQGYLFSKPLPADQLAELLLRSAGTQATS